MKTTSTTITTAQIKALRSEAATADDKKQVAICDRALAGDEDAMNERECSAADLRPGMRFQWAADPAHAHVVCTFMGAAPVFFAAEVRAGLWRFVGTDKGTYPRAAYHAAQRGAS